MATPRSTATSPVSAFPNDLFPLDFLNFPTGPGSTSGSIGMGMDSPEGGMMGMTDSSQAQQMGMYGGLGAGGNDLGTAGSGSNHPTPGNGNLGNTHSQAQGLNIDTSGFDFADGMTGTSNGAGPSSQSYNNGQSHTHNRRDSQGGSLASISEAGPSNTAPGRSTSNRGRPRKSDASKTAKRKSTGQTAARGSINGGMDIDTDPSQLQAHAQALWSQSQAQGMVVDGSGQEMDFPPSGGFGVPIGMLQQLEGFHMQSPLAFDPKNAQSYSNLMPFLSEEAKNGLAQGQLPIGMNGGLLTPGPSGDMFPQFRMDGPQMSPMTLEMLARGEGMDQNSSEFNLLPLLSPALHGHSQSLPSDLTSPAAGFAFSHPHSLGSDSSMQAGHDSQSQNHSQQQGHHPGLHQNTQSGSGSSSVSNLAGRSPLEALQEQQRLFQEQLTALQDQQRQLQATAAAVAAQAMQQQQQQSMAQPGQGQSPARGGNMGMGSTFASGSQQTSPYIAGTSGASSTSGPSRPATTPGNMGSAEPSPSYFSPLTSPALEASARFQSFGHSGGRTSQYNQTFPLSALSSPALNPVGSSGGANQTLSPALNPVLDSGLDDPEYVRQLLGSMDQMGNNGATGQGMMMQGQNGNSGAPMAGAPSQIFSPVQMPTMASHSHGHSHSSHTSSPLVTGSAGSSAGPGPHRQSLPPKTRPSPLIKPTHHRHRHGGNGSIPSSPLIPIYKNSNAAAMAMMGGGNATNGAVVPGTYLPSAAVEQVAQTASTSSTPSPVDLRDLRDIMPPPPVPSKHTQNGDGSMNGMGMSGHGMVQPMTPAAMMNMGSHPVGMSMSMSRGIGSGMGSVTLPSSNAAEEQRLTGKGSGINGAGPARVANGATSGANQGQGNGAKMPIAPGPKGRKTAIAPAAPHAQDGPSPGAAGSAVRKGKGVKKGGRGGGAVGVRAAIKGAALAAAIPVPDGENRKSSHKAAEQKRRDSLKAGFDELRLLLPPINTEALDPESGEPIPGSSAPRLLPKSSLVPDDNPNRGVSKVALLKFSNEYIVKLHSKVDKRDLYIEKLREEVARLRAGGEGEEVKMTVLVEPDEEDDDLDGLDEDEDVGGGAVEEEVDLLMYDVTAGEEEDEEGDEDAEDGEEGEGSENEAGGGDEDMEDTDDKALTLASASGGNKRARNSVGAASQVGQPKRLTRVASSGRLKGRKSD